MSVSKAKCQPDKSDSIQKSLIQEEEEEEEEEEADKIAQLEEQPGKFDAGQAGQELLKIGLQMAWFSGSYMKNAVLKVIFLFLLYLSYTLIIISLTMLLIGGQSEKDKFISYVKQTGNVVLLLVLIVLAIAIYVLYQMFKTNKKYTPRARKALNLLIDLLRGVFHVVYVIYVQPFIFEKQDNQLLLVSFWLMIASFSIFFLRITLKWVHFYCGTGSGDDTLKIWEKPFVIDQQNMKKQYEMIEEIQEKVASIIEMSHPEPQAKTKSQRRTIGRRRRRRGAMVD